ncbi:MAG: CHAT domain-containing tetratricopeptide repeat protein [Thermoanaerobaculia bacterium]|jgi:CHAT domain-containing protein/tetratricopeptide (TPR) repeat protein
MRRLSHIATLVALLLVPTRATVAETARLVVGAPVAVTVAPGAPASATIEIPADSYLKLEADQASADVSITLFSADGAIVRSGNSTRPPEPETLEALVATAGTYRVEIASVRKSDGASSVVLAALRAPEGDEPSRLEAEMVLAEADRIFDLGDSESQKQAVALYEKALALFRARGDSRTEGIILDSLGWASDLSGDRYAALSWYEKALVARRAAGDRDGEIQTLQGIGLVYNYLADYDQAFAANETALSLAREANDRAAQAGLLHNMGGLCWASDEMQRALGFYGQALAIWDTVDRPLNRASTLNNIGDVYRRLGDYDRALDYFNRALEIRRAQGDRRGEAHSLHTIGLVYLGTGDYAKALDNFTRGLVIRRETGDKRGQAYSLGGSASATAKLGDRDKAIALESEAVALWEEIKEVRAEGEALSALGRLYVDAGRAAEAEPVLHGALGLSRRALDTTTEANTLVGLARLERSRGNLAASKARAEEALAIVETLRSRIASESLRATYLSTVAEIYELYVDLLMEMDRADAERGWGVAAFEASERAKARSLLDALGAASVDLLDGARPGLADAETALRRRIAQIDRKRGALALDPKQKDALDLAELDLEKATAEHAAVIARIRAESPAVADLVEPRTLTLPEIRPLLDDGTLLVEFFLGEKRSYAWAVGRTSVKSWTLPGRAEIEDAARPVYELLSARNSAVAGEDAPARRDRIASADAAWPARASALSAMLFGPLGEGLRAKRIAIVADGALQYVPFPALPRSGADGAAPLVIDSEIVVLPSASSLAMLRREHGSRHAVGPAIAVFADPVFRSDDSRLDKLQQRPPASDFGGNAALMRAAEDTGFKSLPRLRFSRQEADAIVELAGDRGAYRAVDFGANRDAVLGGLVAKARIVHFATHGIVNSREPELSGLVLSLVDEKGAPRDGFLRLRDIYALELDADLVVLSACQTALGRAIRGEGLIGLTRGFMHAGAPRVISSLWRVDDRATADLMKRLYEALLRDGLAPAAALRAAQRSMAQDERWKSPYFWAAFELHGEWR